MASNRKRSRGRIKADNMGQGEGPTVPLQIDAPEESDLWTAWQLFLLDDEPVEFDEPVELQAVELKIGRSYRRDVVGKATSGLGALGPWWIGVQRRCR